MRLARIQRNVSSFIALLTVFFASLVFASVAFTLPCVPATSDCCQGHSGQHSDCCTSPDPSRGDEPVQSKQSSGMLGLAQACHCTLEALPTSERITQSKEVVERSPSLSPVLVATSTVPPTLDGQIAPSLLTLKDRLKQPLYLLTMRLLC